MDRLPFPHQLLRRILVPTALRFNEFIFVYLYVCIRLNFWSSILALDLYFSLVARSESHFGWVKSGVWSYGMALCAPSLGSCTVRRITLLSLSRIGIHFIPSCGLVIIIVVYSFRKIFGYLGSTHRSQQRYQHTSNANARPIQLKIQDTRPPAIKPSTTGKDAPPYSTQTHPN